MDEVPSLARPLRYDEGLVQTFGADRGLDAVVSRMGCAARSAFVRVDPPNVEDHQLEPVVYGLGRTADGRVYATRHDRASATSR